MLGSFTDGGQFDCHPEKARFFARTKDLSGPRDSPALFAGE
jgi:hypothetical protein